MSEPAPDDLFGDLLARFDEALAEGRADPEAAADAPADPAARARLARAQACLRRLEEDRRAGDKTTLPPVPPAPAGEGMPAALGRFRLVRPLGAGAFGVVYLAEDPLVGRPVALKVPRREVLLTPGLRDRFLREARAAGRLHHPNIVAIHEVGTAGPFCYLVTAYCPGGTLAEWLRRQAVAVPFAAAADLIATLATAVQHAHEQGVIHRDLKPANILVASDQWPVAGQNGNTGDSNLAGSGNWPQVPGQCQLTDFGLAKVLDDGGDTAQTHSQAVLGTPTYMAPEQAEGRARDCGPATDVYSLGVILYELLTGRVPFLGASVAETLDLVRHQEPVPPARLRPGLPRGLESICLQCLHKEPGRRYATARALAEDLGRWRRGESITARPAGGAERLWRWARRRPALAGLYAVTAVAAVLLLGLAFWFTAALGAAGERAAVEESRRQAAEAVAATQEYYAALHRADTFLAAREPGWTWAALAEVARAARLPLAAGQGAELRSRAVTALLGFDVRQRTRLVPDLVVHSVAWAPDGRTLALGQIRAVNLLTPLQVALVDPTRPADPRWLSFPGVPIFVKGTFGPSQDGIHDLSFSPDGRWLAAGTRSGRAHLWDLRTDPPAHTVQAAHPERGIRLTFSRDSQSLFTAGVDGVARWDPTRWVEQGRFLLGNDQTFDLAVDPGTGVLLWDSGIMIPLTARSLDACRGPFGSPVRRLAFAPDGRQAVGQLSSRPGDVMAPGGMAGLTPSLGVAWHLPGPEPHQDHWAWTVTVSPTLIAGVSPDSKRLFLWDRLGPRPVGRLPLGDGGELAFAPDGQALAVASDRGALLLEVRGPGEQTVPVTHPFPVLAVAPHPHGRLAVVTARGHDGAAEPELTLGPFAAPEAESRWTLPPPSEQEPTPNYVLALDPDGGRLALAGHRPGGLKVWDLEPSGRWGRYEQNLMPTREPYAMAYDPGGRLWVAGDTAVWRFDDPARGRAAAYDNRMATLGSGLEQVYGLAAGADAVVLACRDGGVRWLRPADATLGGGARVADHPLRSVALTADGRTVAVGTDRGLLHLLHLPGLKPAAPPVAAHTDRIDRLAFGPAGYLASAGQDRAIRLWHWDGSALHDLYRVPLPAEVAALAFDPDGVRLLVLLQGERGVRCWHLDRLRQRLAEVGLNPGAEPGAVRDVTSRTPPTPTVPPTPGPHGLRVEGFASRGFARPVRVTHDHFVGWDGKKDGPFISGLPTEDYGYRATGWIKAPRPGEYRVILAAGGQARLFVDGQLVLEARANEQFTRVPLDDRPHAVRIEYQQAQGPGFCRLAWACHELGLAVTPMPQEAFALERATLETP